MLSKANYVVFVVGLSTLQNFHRWVVGLKIISKRLTEKAMTNLHFICFATATEYQRLVKH